MSEDQPTEAEVEATPPGTPDATEELYRKRFDDLRPQYDRTQNELHQARQELGKYNDPEQRRQLIEEWGYTLDEGEPAYEESYQDPDDAVRRELAEIKAQQQKHLEDWQNFQQQQQEQTHMSVVQSYSGQKFRELNVPDPDQLPKGSDEAQAAEMQRQWIADRASSMPGLMHEGFPVPDVEAAHAEYRKLVALEQSSWARSKKDVPFTPTGGQENTGVPAWSDDADQRASDRQQSMMERLRALQD